MSMTSTYNEKILELLLRDFLAEGTIPTADQLTEAYDEYTKNHPDMTKPFVLDEEHTVEEDEDSSAAKYNLFLETIKSDLEAAYKEVWDRTADSMDSFDRWRLGLEGLRNRLVDLESRVDALLMLGSDTEGYYAFVEDNFVDFSKIDQDTTTANVDVVYHTVTIGEPVGNVTKVPLNDIDAKDASFTLLTRELISFSKAAPGTDLRFAVADGDGTWQHRVKSNYSDRKVSGEYKVKLSDSAIDVSKIEMQLHASNLNSSTLVTVMYSTDNYNWYNLPTDQYVQSVDDKAVFFFPVTSMQWVKFIMTKLGADDMDDNMYVYEFGAQWIKFYSTSGYDVENGNLLFSKELAAYDENDERVKFNKVALQACQSLPEDTSIQYWISASNGTDETDWMRIDPHNQPDATAPLVLDLGRAVTTEVGNLQIVPKGIGSPSADFFSMYGNLLKSDRLALLGVGAAPEASEDAPDSAYTVAAVDVSRMIDDQIILYRNIGDYQGTIDSSRRLVRDAPRGWRYTDETQSYLETNILIGNTDGLEFDLGSASAFLDGKKIGPGKVLIPYGTHTFKTLTKNTAELDDMGPYSTVDELNTALDATPLGSRRRNHRLLVEGARYDTDFPEEDKIYPGVDLYCEYIARRVSVFDLLNNISKDEYSYFAVDNMPNGDRVFLVRFDPVDYVSIGADEYFTLSYALGDSMFDRIYFKAQLNSISSTGDVTPVLTAYRIKLGS